MPLYKNRYYVKASVAQILAWERTLSLCIHSESCRAVEQWARDNGALGLVDDARAKRKLLLAKEKENGQIQQ